jgi:hypothetical protein
MRPKNLHISVGIYPTLFSPLVGGVQTVVVQTLVLKAGQSKHFELDEKIFWTSPAPRQTPPKECTFLGSTFLHTPWPK